MDHPDASRELEELRSLVEELRQTEAKYRSLVETLPAVVYLDEYNVASTSIYISPHVETMLGYPPSEWQADRFLWAKILHPDDYERAMADQEEVLRTFAPWREEYRMMAKDGAVVWVDDRAVVVRSHSGEPLGWQGVWIDITPRKRAEADLQAALTREQDMVSELQASHELKDTVLHAVSHDLRTALTTMLGSAITLERAEAELAPQERRELLAGLASGARRANRIVNDLLDTDRLERGLVLLQRSPLDVGALAARVVSELELGERIQLDVQPVVVDADGAKVERILENLLTNFVRYTPADTAGWCRVRPDDEGGVRLVVEDAGSGVDDADKERIFEPFGRGPEGQGIGIGLSLVARFAALHGGRAWVEDRPGGGASFHVQLPGS